MESRLDRYKRVRKEKFIRKLKFFTILIILSTMSYGLYLVNNTVKDFNIIENDNLIRFDIKNSTIDLFGKSYYIDLQILKNVFKL